MNGNTNLVPLPVLKRAVILKLSRVNFFHRKSCLTTNEQILALADSVPSDYFFRLNKFSRIIYSSSSFMNLFHFIQAVVIESLLYASNSCSC